MSIFSSIAWIVFWSVGVAQAVSRCGSSGVVVNVARGSAAVSTCEALAAVMCCNG
jgi:hypothetical protein